MDKGRITVGDWVLASIVALGLGALGVHLDGPGINDYADSAAVQQARAEAKFAKAAQAACGANAGWQTVDGHTVQCTTKRGHRTTVVAVR